MRFHANSAQRTAAGDQGNASCFMCERYFSGTEKHQTSFSSQLSSATATKEILEGRLKTNYCEVSIFEPSRNVLSLGNSWREKAEALFELFNFTRNVSHAGIKFLKG